MFQTRSGRAAFLLNNQWMVEEPDMFGSYRKGLQDPETGKHPAHEDLDIIPVTPNDKERTALDSIYRALGLIFDDPVDDVDRRIILAIRACRR